MMKNLGVMIFLKAKPDQTEVVAKLLKDAQEMAVKKEYTASWYSFRIDKDSFGLFGSFNDEDDRNKYLKDEFDTILKGKGEELLLELPEITKIEILSSK